MATGITGKLRTGFGSVGRLRAAREGARQIAESPSCDRPTVWRMSFSSKH
jgi:hypothetical protein